MPIPTPFHERTAALCESHEWRNWSGYLAAGLYEPSHEREYYAIRNAAALIDVSPLFKYDITGPDALRLVNKIITRNAAKCKIGQILYTPWCDEAGKMIDDGTVWRLAENHFRITAADPSLRWFQDCGFGLDATVENVSTRLAALALQGPNARHVLKRVLPNAALDDLKYYHFLQTTDTGFPLTVTRTGYTGDLGFELWTLPEYACQLWDSLIMAGQGYGLLPAGMVALDIARVEAGLLLIEVDYISSQKALTEARKSSPYEAGLGWTVALDKGPFIGRSALVTEKKAGSKWSFVGLDVDWPALEQLFAVHDLPPMIDNRTDRTAIPLYNANGRQVGQVTSRTFSPILKKYLALATVESRYSKPGTRLQVEVTVEFTRQKALAVVTPTPFFNPRRKRA
ncbi:MAG: aminomethyltransferase family protein [Candidatus Promineifilaceae bacterium]